MYLLQQATGFQGSETLWGWLRTKRLSLFDLRVDKYERMVELMRKYSDLPMDFSDASIIVAAEATGVRQVLTFDRHFLIYMLSDGSSLQVLPM
jgi:uncharacterized protein